MQATPFLLSLCLASAILPALGAPLRGTEDTSGPEIAGTVDSESLWKQIFDESESVGLTTSLYTMHFDPKPEHNNQQHMIDLRWHWRSGYLAGFSYFKNSFDQPTQFVYMGHRWSIPRTDDIVYASLVGGLLHGYDGEHKDAIPLNDHGVAPGILPMIGLRYHAVRSEVILFGTAGLTVTLGYDFPLQ